VKGFPAYAWLKGYNKDLLIADSIAAIIVTVMLIPQSLGYAMLAGVSPEVGLYASIIPLVAYALLGTSRTLSVGPVAVISLMTAVAVSDAVAQTGADYHEAAIVLALLSGCVLVVMGFLKFGFLANFFVTSSGVRFYFSVWYSYRVESAQASFGHLGAR
jgi:Sulfate permease and related transporters (MFS superfamily)